MSFCFYYIKGSPNSMIKGYFFINELQKMFSHYFVNSCCSHVFLALDNRAFFLNNWCAVRCHMDQTIVDNIIKAVLWVRNVSVKKYDHKGLKAFTANYTEMPCKPFSLIFVN